MSLSGVSSQVSEVMTLGQQLKDSCSDVDDDELDTQLKELSTLWGELNSNLQQRIQYLQGILLRLGQCHQPHCYPVIIAAIRQDNFMKTLASSSHGLMR